MSESVCLGMFNSAQVPGSHHEWASHTFTSTNHFQMYGARSLAWCGGRTIDIWEGLCLRLTWVCNKAHHPSVFSILWVQTGCPFVWDDDVDAKEHIVLQRAFPMSGVSTSHFIYPTSPCRAHL